MPVSDSGRHRAPPERSRRNPAASNDLTPALKRGPVVTRRITQEAAIAPDGGNTPREALFPLLFPLRDGQAEPTMEER